MISQLTVFLQNKKGHLSRATAAIADAGINMHALFLADTSDFGIARIFCDTPEAAAQVLADAGFRADLVPVTAVRLPNEPGSLARLLRFCDESGMDIAYGYCFAVAGDAVDVLKVDGDDVEERLAAAGFDIVKPEEIYAV